MGQAHGAATISQVAAHLGLATSTVSRAFNRPEMLPAKTVARVKAAAQELGYRPNRVARALSTGRYGNLALIVPDIANPFFPPIIRAAQSYADAQDLYCLLGDSDENAAREEELIARLAPQVEGLLIVSPRLPASRLEAMAARWNIVVVNRDIKGVRRVLIDTSAGVRQGMRHLAELGHRRLAYVGGPARSWSDQQRAKAATAYAREHGLELIKRRATPATYAGAKEVVPDLVTAGVTAVVAFDDVVAQGVIGGLAEHDLAVPADVSVLGCDDTLAGTTHRPLSTIAARCSEAGELAVRLLLEPAEGRRSPDRQVLECPLVLRSTTGPVAH